MKTVWPTSPIPLRRAALFAVALGALALALDFGAGPTRAQNTDTQDTDTDNGRPAPESRQGAPLKSDPLPPPADLVPGKGEAAAAAPAEETETVRPDDAAAQPETAPETSPLLARETAGADQANPEKNGPDQNRPEKTGAESAARESAAGASPPPAFEPWSKREVVERIEDYLNDMDSLRADFTQFAPDLSVRTGRVYLDRPNRIRFEYDPPTELLVVGRGSWIHVLDYELGDRSRYPVEETPLRFLMRKPVRLDGDVEITEIEQLPGQLSVVAVDADDPRQGSLQLVFETGPLKLRNWIITDARGDVTEVSLSALEPNVDIDKDVFDFEKP